ETPMRERPSLKDVHTPPPSFKRGEALNVSANVPSSRAATAGVHLRYRRLNQAEAWRTIGMEKSGAEFRAAIPAEYTDSPYPLQYHFQIRVSGDAWLYPGLQPGWQGQ